jgi:hypothetical protein
MAAAYPNLALSSRFCPDLHDFLMFSHSTSWQRRNKNDGVSLEYAEGAKGWGRWPDFIHSSLQSFPWPLSDTAANGRLSR